VVEVEEVGQRAGLLVEGVVADRAGLPVVLDELEDRRLVGGGVVDEVLLRVRRDDEQREPGTVTAPVTTRCLIGVVVGAGWSWPRATAGTAAAASTAVPRPTVRGSCV
jgi:hypothetical protein